MKHRQLISLRIAALLCFTACCGCNSILNGWLSPIELGAFSRETSIDIRGSLSIQDTPAGVLGAGQPRPEDLQASAQEYRAIPGDTLNIFIEDLRTTGVESQNQATIDTRGLIDLPVLGWVPAAGMTAHELERSLRDILSKRDILHDAQVLVQFAAQRGRTYTLFGNETLAVRFNRGPGVFPIPRPDFQLIEAIAVAGGLSELVRDIYVFRQVRQDKAQAEAFQALREARQSSPPAPQRDQSKTPNDDGFSNDVDPPLPSVVPSVAFGHAGTASSRSPYQQHDDQPNQKPSEAQKKNEATDILDLMGAGPPTRKAEGTQPVTAPEATTPPADQVAPLQQSPDTLLTKPTNWVFDPASGRWMEATTDVPTSKQDQAVVPPDEDAILPAVDWNAIAEEEHDVRTIRIPAQGLRQGDPRYNIVLRPGDIVRLYSGDIGFYYILGHVTRPGVFAFRSGATVTLKNAIAAAGGLTALAWPDRVTVYRRVGDREQMYQVNMDRIFAGLDPDFYLRRDDIVNVGTHPAAPFLLQLRNLTIPQLNSSISFLYRWTRQETFFKNENLDAPNTPGLFP